MNIYLLNTLNLFGSLTIETINERIRKYIVEGENVNDTFTVIGYNYSDNAKKIMSISLSIFDLLSPDTTYRDVIVRYILNENFSYLDDHGHGGLYDYSSQILSTYGIFKDTQDRYYLAEIIYNLRDLSRNVYSNNDVIVSRFWFTRFNIAQPVILGTGFYNEYIISNNDAKITKKNMLFVDIDNKVYGIPIVLSQEDNTYTLDFDRKTIFSYVDKTKYHIFDSSFFTIFRK